MKHWATDLIGKPWDPSADGPERFSCWGLVRHVFRTQYGVEMPSIEVTPELTEANLENVRAIKAAAEVSGWRPVSGMRTSPKNGDIVLMRSVTKVHVGVVISLRQSVHGSDRFRVLHCHHAAGVVCEPWLYAIEGMIPQLWRRA